MKKTWLSILALAGLTASDDASDKIQMQQDELDKIKADLEAGKGHLEAKEKAEADLKVASDALAAAKVTHEAALKEQTDKVATLEAEVKRLGSLPGGTPTAVKTEGDGPEGGSLGLPAYANTDMGIYKELAAQQQRLKG